MNLPLVAERPPVTEITLVASFDRDGQTYCYAQTTPASPTRREQQEFAEAAVRRYFPSVPYLAASNQQVVSLSAIAANGAHVGLSPVIAVIHRAAITPAEEAFLEAERNRALNDSLARFPASLREPVRGLARHLVDCDSRYTLLEMIDEIAERLAEPIATLLPQPEGT